MLTMNPQACTMRPQTSSPAVRRSWQRGGAVLAVMAGLLVMAASTLAIRMARQVEDKTAQQQLTSQRMQRIAQALQGYWLVHGCTLPDGAAGNASTGDAAAGGTTVPWRTLGIVPEDSFDAWGRKLSYKNNAQVNAFGTAAEPPGWVLVSHGPTGLGAWLPSGQQMPTPGNADELTNANLSSPLQLKQESAGVHVLPANLFDDFLLWGSLAVGDCASSGMGEDVIKNLLNDPNAIVFSGGGSGRPTVMTTAGSLGPVKISALGKDNKGDTVPMDISTNADYTGLGVCGSGCGNASNRALGPDESLSFLLTDAGKTAKGLALGLLGLTSTNTTVSVSVTFKLDGVTVGGVTKSALISNTLPTAAQRLIVAPSAAGTAFDEVVVKTGDSTSRFFVTTVIFCQTATCT